MPYPVSAAVDEDMNPESNGRNDNVHPEEASYMVGEKQFPEQPEVQTVLPKKGDELRVGKQSTRDTQNEVSMFGSHDDPRGLGVARRRNVNMTVSSGGSALPADWYSRIAVMFDRSVRTHAWWHPRLSPTSNSARSNR